MKKLILLMLLVSMSYAYIAVRIEPASSIHGDYCANLECRTGKTLYDSGEIIGYEPSEFAIGIGGGIIHDQPYGRAYWATVRELYINHGFGLTATTRKGVGYIKGTDKMCLSLEILGGFYWRWFEFNIGYETTTYHKGKFVSPGVMRLSISFNKAIIN